ncbi:MAG: hypothetical protein ACFHX7_05585 [Pseudomonadota bacterium]
MPAAATLQVRQIMQAGKPLSYWIFVPPQPAQSPRPMLLVLPDDQDTAYDFLRTGDFMTDATARGYIVVAPDTGGVTGPGIISDIATAVSASLAVDESRVLIAGQGRGGEIALNLIRSHAHPFAAGAFMAPSTEAPPAEVPAEAPARAIPLMLTYGEANAGNLANARQWASRLGCGMSLQARNEFVEQVGFYGCRNGAEVIYQTIEGLAGWTGRVVSNATGRAGSVSLTTLAWQFFDRTAPGDSSQGSNRRP